MPVRSPPRHSPWRLSRRRRSFQRPAVAAPQRDQGFALLIVLWTIALLALLGTTVTATGRSEASIAGNTLAAATAEAAADGAVAVAEFHLLAGAAAHWDADGRPHAIRVGAGEVELRLLDQRGKLDPNDAPPTLMAALLRQRGVDPGTAASLAAAITDWRSVDTDGGAGLYERQQRGYAPPHEPFQSIDELALVAFMTPRLLSLLAPDVSLYIEQTPDSGRASAAVSAALADVILHHEMTQTVDQPGLPVILVVATAQVRGAVFTRRALIRLTDAAKPCQILEWH